MTPESEAEIKSDLKYLVKLVEEIRRAQDDLAQRVSRVEGRIEEQSKFLQLVIGSKISRKTAA